jgi:hypothetical protein
MPESSLAKKACSAADWPSKRRHSLSTGDLHLVADCKTAHDPINLDLYLISNLGCGYENDKALDPSDTVSFASDILDLDVILLSDLYRRSHGGPALITSEQ